MVHAEYREQLESPKGTFDPVSLDPAGRSRILWSIRDCLSGIVEKPIESIRLVFYHKMRYFDTFEALELGRQIMIAHPFYTARHQE